MYFTFLLCFCYIPWSVCQSFTGSHIFPKFIFKISFICEISVIYPPLHGSRLCDPRTAFVRKNILSTTKSLFLFLVWDGRNVLSGESNEYTWIPKYVLNFSLFTVLWNGVPAARPLSGNWTLNFKKLIGSWINFRLQTELKSSSDVAKQM